MKKLYILLFLLLIISCDVFANIDSIKKQLRTKVNDTVKVNILNDLSKYYKDINAEEGLQYGHSALELSTKLDYKIGVAEAYKNIGLNYWRMSIYEMSLENYFKAYDLFDQLKDTAGVAITNNYIGLIYLARSQYYKAIEFLEASVKLNSIIKNQLEVARSQLNLGIVHHELKHFEQAIDYHLKSLHICESIDSNISASNYCFLGKTYSSLQKNDSAYYYLNKSLEIFKKLNSPNNIAMVQNQIALFYNRTSEFDKALVFARNAYDLGEKIGNRFMRMEALHLMSEAYKGLRMFEKAYFTHVDFKELQDSLVNESNIKSIARKETQFEYEKKLKEIEIDKQNQLYKQDLINKVAIFSSLILLIISLFIYRYYRIRTKTNKVLTEKNNEIFHQREELAQLNIQLQESNSSKDKFFSIIAHDLKSPLSGFLGTTKIMAEESSDLTLDEMRELSRNMQESARHIYKLLENLLEWSRIQRGVIDYNPDACSLAMLVKNNIDLQTIVAHNKQIKLINSVDDRFTVLADVSMINTVIRNLISNSLKFTPKGGRIEIGAEDYFVPENEIKDISHPNSTTLQDKFVKVFIKDNGIGMNSEILKNVFMVDKKTSRPGTENEPSTGLGLLLCKEFIEKNGGSIWAESTEGVGTVFYFSLRKLS